MVMRGQRFGYQLPRTPTLLDKEEAGDLRCCELIGLEGTFGDEAMTQPEKPR